MIKEVLEILKLIFPKELFVAVGIILLIIGIPVGLFHWNYEEKMVSGIILQHSVTSNMHSGASYNTLVQWDESELGVENRTSVNLYLMPVGTRIHQKRWVSRK